ncbi:MAG: chromosome segregation protein SMC [Phycisphaerales bacterium]|nr:chromosome segregation protein SMC [Phycisphaerales bacterium]
MQLTKLTVNGFKSFADKTTFDFTDPITGIVGPNGCGKSNVVDAIKWVLGERSSKSLRGKEMLDVIFAGSVGRKPSGMAAVALTFANPIGGSIAGEGVAIEIQEDAIDEPEETHPEHDAHISDEDADRAAEEGESEASAILTERARINRPLPIDSDVVEVERRLYRDGKSQYLINSKLARLKDIRDLFLDTGIGADAYSIIEQGKVDRMLLASPMERRVIFEEAAGIAKYRQRRVESERRLEKTETNLIRTREQLDSTERRLRMVKGQASKARRFAELDSEYSALRVALAFELYDDIRKRLEGLTSQIASLEDEKRATEEALREAEDAQLEAQSIRGERLRALREVEERLTRAKHDADSATQRSTMTARAIEDAAHTVETETTRLNEATNRLAELDAQIGSGAAKTKMLEESLSSIEARLQQAASEKEIAGGQALACRQSLDEARASGASIEREHATLVARVAADEKRIEAAGEQSRAIEQRVLSIESGLSESQSLAEQAQTRSTSIDARASRLREQLSALDTQAQQTGESRSELAQAVNTLDEERVRLETRHATLEEMVRSREGLDDAVRTVLEQHESGKGFSTVLGSLAELIEVGASDAPMVEAALERSLQAVVVESMAQMPTSDELESLPGRVAFLPAIGGTRAPSVYDPIVGMESLVGGGRVRAVRSLVRAKNNDPRVESLLDRLLARTVVVGDLDSAMLLEAGPMRAMGVRYVTRAGVVIEPDGQVVAGPAGASHSAGIIARQSELHELQSVLESVRSRLSEQRSALEAVDADAARLAEQRSVVHTALGEAGQELMKASHAIDRHRSDIDRQQRELERARDEGARLGERIEQIRTERDELHERSAKLERLMNDERARVETLSLDMGRAEESLASLVESLGAIRVQASTASEQLRSEQRQLAQVRAARDDAERQTAEAQRHIERARANLEEHQKAMRESSEQLDRAHALISELEEVASERAEQVRATDERTRLASETVTKARDRADAFTRDWHAIESSRRELEVRRENAEERTMDDLGFELALEYPEYRVMMQAADSGWTVERIDVNDTTARVNVLKGEIKKLGHVNLNAIEEEANLSERNEELISQVRDIDEARIKLATLIEKLNVASRARFGEVFERIQHEFGARDGMFRRLFGGGRAEVRLMGLVKEIDGQKIVTDEVDLLESGIEVIAKPPGKEPRSINQLSGGEKTMTAVAMLLAIFRSKPSCFCVLDEVDAALDEANVARFCGTLDLFTDQSRFVVITHNKRTMQATNRLFGVTMQERGVSKRVEVRFDQVGSDGTIDKSAVDAATIEDEPAESKPGASGGLRKALAGMREEERIEAE